MVSLHHGDPRETSNTAWVRSFLGETDMVIGLRQVTLQRSILLDSIGAPWCSVTWNPLGRQNHNLGVKTSMWKYYVFD